MRNHHPENWKLHKLHHLFEMWWVVIVESHFFEAKNLNFSTHLSKNGHLSNWNWKTQNANLAVTNSVGNCIWASWLHMLANSNHELHVNSP